MKTPTKFAIVASVAVIGGVALAGTSVARGGFGHHGGPLGGGAGAMIMEQFDADQDGSLTKVEIDENIQSRLAAADSNGDGQLDLEEFQPILVELMRPRIVDAFQFLDADGSAAISIEEIERPVAKVVSRLDRNDDGTVTRDEMKKRHRGWRRGHHDRDKDHGETDG